MDTKFVEVRNHGQVEILDEKDINGMFMVKCDKCKTFAHAFDKNQAVKDLSFTSCAPNCVNCNSLRNSYDQKPAVPINGSCNDKLHTCPIDRNRWWQYNTYYHLWKQVTNDQEWESLDKKTDKKIC